MCGGWQVAGSTYQINTNACVYWVTEPDAPCMSMGISKEKLRTVQGHSLNISLKSRGGKGGMVRIVINTIVRTELRT